MYTIYSAIDRIFIYNYNLFNQRDMEDSSEKEPKAIRQARASLINGDVFYKVSNRSRFSSKQKLNQRYLWVSNDLMSIKWCNGNQKKRRKG